MRRRQPRRGAVRKSRAGLSQTRGPQSPPSQRLPRRLCPGRASAAVWPHVWHIQGESGREAGS